MLAVWICFYMDGPWSIVRGLLISIVLSSLFWVVSFCLGLFYLGYTMSCRVSDTFWASSKKSYSKLAWACTGCIKFLHTPTILLLFVWFSFPFLISFYTYDTGEEDYTYNVKMPRGLKPKITRLQVKALSGTVGFFLLILLSKKQAFLSPLTPNSHITHVFTNILFL